MMGIYSVAELGSIEREGAKSPCTAAVWSAVVVLRIWIMKDREVWSAFGESCSWYSAPSTVLCMVLSPDSDDDPSSFEILNGGAAQT